LKISRLAACSLVAVLAYSSVVSIASAASPGTPKPPPGKTAPKRHAPSAAQAGAGQAALRQLSGTPMDPAAELARAPRLSVDLHAIAGVPGAQTQALPKVALEKNGTVEVTLTGDAAAHAVRSAGGRVLAQAAGSVTALVAPTALRALASTPGVNQVRSPKRAVMPATSEGVGLSGAQTWINNAVQAGSAGTGVTVAIVDGGFKDVAAEVTANNLPAGTTVNGDHCANIDNSQHGTAVAEIVHQMAPAATLLLYCVDDNVGFAQSATELKAAGATIVNSSLGFPADSRGDGYGAPDSTVVTVRKARQAGILWIQSAGNSGDDHWSGTLTDGDQDHFVDLNGLGSANNYDEFLVPSGGSASMILQWDRWPTSPAHIALNAVAFECADSTCSQWTSNNPVLQYRVPQVAGTEPSLGISPPTNSSPNLLDWFIGIEVAAGAPTGRYDLNYVGNVSQSYLAFLNPARGAAGSISAPANSPYALAVGAVDQNGQNLETFSSRGPTIDGRVKPDLLGFDGVSSNLSDFSGGFFGTSAAAPHVAGAGALVKWSNAAMSASDIQAFLERRATQPASPPTNTVGHGVLNLGANSDVAPVAGSGYFALPNPVRIADTRTGLGGVPNTIMGTGAAFQVVVPNSLVPSDATAVVLNISGVGARGSTFLSVYSGPNWGGNSTLNLNALDANATVAAIVKLNGSHAFFVRNQLYWTHAVVTLVGYFGAPTAGGLSYKALPSNRLLDTRTSIGGHQRKLAVNEIVTVQVANRFGVPANATAAVVNMTALNQTAGGYLTAYPYAPTGVASVDYRKYSRSNLVIVPLSGGNFSLGNRFASTDAMVDIVGYFGGTAATAKFVPLPSSVRIVDTRNGNGGFYGTLAANYTVSEDAGGLNGVPFDATGVWIGITAIASGSGYVTIYPNGTVAPHASNLDYTPGRVVPNAGIATLSAPTATVPPGFSTVNRFGLVNVLEDVYGYFSG
jgi:hypothetical protein